jgi:hypothetical protein
VSDPTIPTTPPAEADQGAGVDELGRLRSENASWRRKLRDTEQGQGALVEAARAEERAAMTGKLLDATIVAGASRFSDVRDALGLIDRDGLVTDAGEIDGNALADRLDALLAERPHLAAGRRFAGSADQGARTSTPVTSGDWARDLLRRRE